MDPATALQRLGFSEYEARAYVALVKESPLNGYELAKASAIPRANIYAVLDKLTERRAVVRMESPQGVRYGPVPPDALIQRLGAEYQQSLDISNRTLQSIAVPVEHEYVWNARGYPALLDQIRAAIRTAKHDLLIALWPTEAAALAGELQQTQDRNVGITTLCMAACFAECGCCKGSVHRYRVNFADSSRWLIAVADEHELVAGEITSEIDALAFKTSQPLVVELGASYIRNTIALNTVMQDLGPHLDELLAPQTKAILTTLGPRRSVGFLEYLRRLMSGNTATQ